MLLDNDDLVMTIVTTALTHAPAQREHYLRQACSGNDELFDFCWTYLQAEEQMKGFLSDPLVPREVDDPPLQTGDLLASRFRIMRLVGEGGMALVYEAYDAKLDRRVAVKWPKGEFRKRVPPEVRHAREISHPNVCRIFDIHTVSRNGHDTDFLTMEYLEGETLSQRLARARLTPAEAEDLALQLCAGLTEAHRNEVVHGDLKTNNIILAPRQNGSIRAVITDFGLARAPGSQRHALPTSTRGGTPDYMAPELWKGEQPTRASDIYALGVILHELITGSRPVNGKFRPDPVDPRWRRAIARCLHPDPSARFESAEDAAAVLGAGPRRRLILALAGSGIAAAASWSWLTQSDFNGALAVLPLSAPGGYLADGLSESLINTLSAVPNLKVISRTSTERFRGANPDLRAVGRALHVDALLTGTVNEINGKVELAFELIDANDGSRMWGGRYTTTLAGLRGVESQVLREVAARLGAALTRRDWNRIAAGNRILPEAYALLLQGRYHMHLYTPESRRKAMDCYQQAVAVDPGSALVHAELARAYRLLEGSAVVDPREALPKAEAATRCALAIDNELAEAHAALADIRKDQWNWSAAETEYLRAADLNPNLVYVYQGYAIYLTIMHRFPAAIRQIQRARQIDPFGLPTAVHAAAVYYNCRRFEEAMQALKRASELDPSAPSPWTWTAMTAAALGDWNQAIAAYVKSAELGDTTAATQCYYAYALAARGEIARCAEVLKRIEQSHEYFPRSSLAVVYAAMREHERAIATLQEAYEARDPFLQYLDVEPHYDKIRGDPRFVELRHKIGLPS